MYTYFFKLILAESSSELFDRLSSVVCLSVRLSINFSYFRILKNHRANFNQTCHKASLGDCSNEGPNPFPKGDYYEISKIHWRNRKDLLLQNHLANFNQTCQKASLGGEEGPNLFSRGDNDEIAKIHWQNLKIFFSRTAGTISTKLAQSILGQRVFKFV